MDKPTASGNEAPSEASMPRNMDAGYENKPPTASEIRWFTWLVLLVQFLGLAAVVMVAVWMGHFRGGFAWQSDPGKEFSYHPLFMVIGLIFLYSDAILAYRVFRNEKKLFIKILHGCMHAAALLFAAVGLKAVFDSHNLAPTAIPNLYSLHSWLGLISVILFGLQWVVGFASFLFPGAGMLARRLYMPHHQFWGLAILCTSTASALMGITEKAIFSKSAPSPMNYSDLPAEAILLNCLGLVLVALVTLVAYLVTRPEYKRPPAPEEQHLQLGE